MPRQQRAQRFLFDPLALTRDPARRSMSLEARGAYDSLIAESWFEKVPGTLPDDDKILAALAQCDMATWLRLRPEIEPAFTRDMSRKLLVTSEMQRAFSEQSAKRDAWRKRQRDKRLRERDMGVTSPVGSGSGSSSGTGTTESCDASHRAVPALEASPESSTPLTPEPEPDSSTPEQAAQVASLFRSAVSTIAEAHDLNRTPHDDLFPAERIWEAVKSFRVVRYRKLAMSLAGRLWKQRATRDPEVLLRIVTECCARQPGNPYAYFAANGEAFGTLRMQSNADRSIAAHEQLKAADRALFPRRSS